ncbi:MAG TPA: hypothetical protein VLL08_20570 [Kineosporiaceae bacterium]|nr:hypothetical protein [Kineosporiaceae bacterium]
MSGIPARRASALPIALATAGALAACSGGSAGPTSTTSPATPTASATSRGLESYTDTGDGCAQAISAISYADDALRALGQEPYQEFDDVVRSRLAAVAGTLALEAKDWPDEPVHRQAEIVQPLAQAAAARLPNQTATAKAARINALLRYRIEAATLILVCRDAAPPTP